MHTIGEDLQLEQCKIRNNTNINWLSIKWLSCRDAACAHFFQFCLMWEIGHFVFLIINTADISGICMITFLWLNKVVSKQVISISGLNSFQYCKVVGDKWVLQGDSAVLSWLFCCASWTKYYQRKRNIWFLYCFWYKSALNCVKENYSFNLSCNLIAHIKIHNCRPKKEQKKTGTKSFVISIYTLYYSNF